MNKIYYIFSIFITGLIFCLAYMPQSTLQEDIKKSGLEFGYVTKEASCFTKGIEPIGLNSHKWILNLNSHKPSNPIYNEAIYVSVGYMMKQVTLKYKSNVFQSQLSNTLYDKNINYSSSAISNGS
jgi:hypothetical protein